MVVLANLYFSYVYYVCPTVLPRHWRLPPRVPVLSVASSSSPVVVVLVPSHHKLLLLAGEPGKMEIYFYISVC